MRLIVAIVGVIGSITGIILALKRQPKEIRQIDGDIGAEGIDSIADALKIARDAAAQVTEMQDKLKKTDKTHKAEMDGLRIDVNELKYELDKATAEIDVLKDWSQRLVYQVQSLGADPVKPKQARKVVRSETY